MGNNEILGIGTDIIEIKRIEKAIKSQHFIERVYTPKEIEYIKNKGNKSQTFAGIFCAKESVCKAIGTGFSGKKFHDIEILHDEKGKPFVSGINVLITISHCKEYATSTAILLN